MDSALAAQQAESTSLATEAARLEVAIAEAEKDITVAIAGEEAARAESAAGLPDDLAAAVRRPARAPRRGGCGEAGGGPVRRLPPHPVLGRDRAYPAPAAR